MSLLDKNSRKFIFKLAALVVLNKLCTIYYLYSMFVRSFTRSSTTLETATLSVALESSKI